MDRERLVQKLLQIYGSGELEQIKGVASEISECFLGPVHELRKKDKGPAPGEYDEKTRTITLYEDNFNPKVLFHEIGHCIYHECPEIAKLTNGEYKKDVINELETTGEGLSWERAAAEFCANAYQLYKTGTISTDEAPERFRSLAEKLKEKRF